MVRPEHRVLNKAALGHQREEVILVREVVLAAVFFAGAGRARGVCIERAALVRIHVFIL